MKLRQGKPEELHSDLKDTLVHLRDRRGFRAGPVLDAKIQLLKEYFQKNNLDAAVVGVSGGIDSAVVAAMLTLLKNKEESPLKKIYLVTLPSFTNVGVTGQSDSIERASELVQSLKETLIDADMTNSVNCTRIELENEIEGFLNPWAVGQLTAYQRTSYLYGLTSSLSQQGFRPCVVGTTNRDEGAYLGYVGKAADGMVDIQPIADLHKSEVYAIAKLLNIPKSILEVEPTGDMFDGAPDVEVFGAPYDYVEFFILWKTIISNAERCQEADLWSLEAFEQACEYNRALGKLHELNAHKYKVGWPSVFLDVMPRCVPGGWEEKVTVKRTTIKPQMASVFALPGGDRSEWMDDFDTCGSFGFVPIFQRITQGINQEGLDFLNSYVGSGGWAPAGEDGRWNNLKGPVGSFRCTFEDDAFANALWQQISKTLEPFRHFTSDAGPDVDGSMIWRPVGVSSNFRVIRYLDNGKLIPHYDAPFVESEDCRTLQSVVIPIQGNGVLNIHKDGQAEYPFHTRDFSDETAKKVAGPPFLKIENRPGDILVFDHRILHSPDPGPRTIIRTDIIFERSV